MGLDDLLCVDFSFLGDQFDGVVKCQVYEVGEGKFYMGLGFIFDI